MANLLPAIRSPYLTQHSPGQTLYIVIAGDRGLAGGYNNSVFKKAMSCLSEKEGKVLPLGRKAVDYFGGQRIPLYAESYPSAEKLTWEDCLRLGRKLASVFLTGEFTQIRLIYTQFVSVLTQIPAEFKLLPLGLAAEKKQILFEPDADTFLEKMMPVYLGGMVYGALCQSRVSEQAARRVAMDAATRNADEMIDALRLQFNRTRQAAITQEITEIVAGN
jgi:F-type H+-transporting ATPase subunit gamma